MLFSSIFFVPLFSAMVVAGDIHLSLSSVRQAFEAADIPNTLAISFDPQVLLQVTYPGASGGPITVRPGDQLSMNETAAPPLLGVVGKPRSPGPYVVALIDPDAPTPQNPNISQFRHFLGGNFFTDAYHCNVSALLINSTAAVTEYAPPTPPVFSDPHRYIFLLFEQSTGFNDQTLINATSSRLYFNISSFAHAVGLGDPVGGTFMYVGPDLPAAT